MWPIDRPPTWVDRSQELATLRAGIEALRQGGGAAVWVEGEPGIGKSSLVGEALAGTSELGWDIGWGIADQLTERLPLSVVQDCLQVRLSSPDPRRAHAAGLLRSQRLGLFTDGDASASGAEVMMALTDELCAALLERHGRGQTAHPALISQILNLLPKPARPAPPPSGQAGWACGRSLDQQLTDSESRVLRYLPTHLTAPEIAAELWLSVNTVNTHTRHLYAKLGVHGRREAVERARALGLLAPSARRAKAGSDDGCGPVAILTGQAPRPSQDL